MRFEEQIDHVVVRYPELRVYGPQPRSPRSFRQEVCNGVALGRRLHGRFVRETAKTIAKAVAKPVKAAIDTVARDYAYRQTVRALRELEDHRLEDIGIERRDIRTVARALAWGEPTSKARTVARATVTTTETGAMAKAA